MTRYTRGTDSDTPPVDHGESTIQGEWDRSEQPSVEILEAVADATDHEPTALPPLYRSVDPDALDALLTGGVQRAEPVHVSFAYDDVLVSVGSDGDLTIRADGTTHDPSTTVPETSADLHATLAELLREASRNGVSVSGGYGVRNGPESPDWDVHVTQVGKRRDGDA